MASGIPAPTVDLRAQIIENCQFYSGPYARISLITTREPLGSFKVIVLRTEDGVREALLSETAPSFYDALEALLCKSAEAVQSYIGNNGFALVSSVKKRSSEHAGSHDDGHDSDSALSNVTLDDCESLSDNETISVTSVGRAKRSRRKADRSAKTSTSKHKTRQGRPRSRSPSSSTTRARSRSSSCSLSGSELHYDPPVIPSRRPPFLNAFSQRMPPRPPQSTFPPFAMAPPPPPPGPPGGISTGAGYLRNQVLSVPPPPPRSSFPFHKQPPPPPPAPTTTTTATTVTPTSTPTSPTAPIAPAVITVTAPTRHDIILLIRWRHHGERRAVEQTSQMTVRGIQQAALAFVRRQAASFANVPPPEGKTLPVYRMMMAGLKAAVKAVVVDGVAYDLSGYVGEDLSRFVASLASSSGSGTSSSGTGDKAGGVPLFEVDVWSVGVGGNGNGEGVVSVGVPVRSGPGSGGGVSDGGVNSQVVVNGVSVGPRMVFPSPPGMPPN